MMGLSFPHLIVAGAVILLLFGGKGKISDIMGDFAKGIKSFKKGMSDDDAVETKPGVGEPVRTLDHRSVGTADVTTESRRVG